jgi:hypothetical protein
MFKGFQGSKLLGQQVGRVGKETSDRHGINLCAWRFSSHGMNNSCAVADRHPRDPSAPALDRVAPQHHFLRVQHVNLRLGYNFGGSRRVEGGLLAR